MANVKEGDRVRIVAREQTEEDVKSGLYYGHFGGMTGQVQKVYSKAEVAVEVDHESLTKEIRDRHHDVRNQMKTKWLDGLSEEGRNRLTEREKDFNLRYMIVVGMDDLERAGARAATASERKPAPDAVESGTPARPTSADLDAAEAAELARRAAGGGNA